MMQISKRLWRFAATLILFLPCVGVPLVAAAERTQGANLSPVVVLSATTLEDAPAALRGDLLLANDGNIYFVSSAGGKGLGTIAKLAPNNTLSVVHALADADEGGSSYAKLVQASDGNLYGTTYLGGDQGGGVVFRVTPAGAYTVLHAFDLDNKGAGRPYTGLVQAGDGNLYGTTLRGGDNDRGTVYRIGIGGEFSVIHSFNGDDGQSPEGTLIVGHDGNLYGTTLQGGTDNRGVIYRISTAGNFERLYSFPSLGAFNSSGLATNTTGANPRAGLLLGADGNYYGTAYQGGAHGYGTLFRMSQTGEVTLVHAFAGPSFGAGFPLSGVVQDADGNFYGTSERGGYINRGAAWRVDTAGTFTLLHGFTGAASEGMQPYAGLLFANGALYGASFSDQVSGTGAIFKLDLGSGGVLPVELSVSATDINVGSGVTLTWSAPAAATCTKNGAWTGDTAITGTESVTPAGAGIYTYGLSCTDAATVVRSTYATVVVRAPPTEPVDGGGGGGGALSWLLLLLIAALLSAKFIKEIRSPCP
jgi:uncharacterized repeat protein (TIGR03803 family)